MAEPVSLQTPGPIFNSSRDPLSKRLRDFPWWFVAIIMIAIWAAFIILSNDFLCNIDQSFIDTLDAKQVSEALKAEFEIYEEDADSRGRDNCAEDLAKNGKSPMG